MHFFYRNRHLLVVVAVLLFSSVMVLREISEAGSRHIQRREDFLLLYEMGRADLVATRYQLLVQELPKLNDRLLSEDLQRTRTLVDPEKPDQESMVWKYHISVSNELKKRAEKRISPVIGR